MGGKAPPERQCLAWLTDGSRRCERWRMAGTTVCYKHGGAAGQVRRAAARRQAELETIERACQAAADRGIRLDPGRMAALLLSDRRGFNRQMRSLTKAAEEQLGKARTV